MFEDDEFDYEPLWELSQYELIRMVRRLEKENTWLEEKLYEAKREVGEYLSKWASAANLAASRNILLLLEKSQSTNSR